MCMRTRGWKTLAAAALAAIATPAIIRWLRRLGAARRAIDMRMTLVVERPIVDVFEFARDFENFPQITESLLSIEDSQDGRSHWAVRSPTGHSVEWDATITKYVPSSVIAWESVPDSPVKASGLMRFFALSPTETRVDLTITYRPLRTGFADAIRALVGANNTVRLRTDLAQATHEMAPR